MRNGYSAGHSESRRATIIPSSRESALPGGSTRSTVKITSTGALLTGRSAGSNGLDPVRCRSQAPVTTVRLGRKRNRAELIEHVGRDIQLQVDRRSAAQSHAEALFGPTPAGRLGLVPTVKQIEVSHAVDTFERAERALIVIQADGVGRLGVADRAKLDHPPVRALDDSPQAGLREDPEVGRVLVELGFTQEIGQRSLGNVGFRSGRRRVMRVLRRQNLARFEIVSRT